MIPQYTYDNKGRALGVFIPISDWKKITKKYSELEDKIEDEPPTKQEILESIKEGIHLAKLHQQGKVKLKSAQQLMDEL